MEFTKQDAFARLCEGKKAQVHETHRLLEKRSRHLMEQSALLQHDIDTFKNDLSAIDIQYSLPGIVHVCACSPLYPVVWSMLPMDLLQRVFACLPCPDIIRLRVLSKTWDQYVTGVTPGFTKLCAKQSPSMFALLKGGSRVNDFSGDRMDIQSYNSEKKKWQHSVHEKDLHNYSTLFASDGGLVCFVSLRSDSNEVYNPLTRQSRKLPLSSSLSQIMPRMVQLVMDQDSKCYKVLIVGSKKQGEGNLVARIFNSAIGKWSESNIFSDLIFGNFHWLYSRARDLFKYDNLTKKYVGPCVYDCTSTTLIRLYDDSCPYKSKDIYEECDSEVLVKDHLFCLHMNSERKYLLTEYQAQSCQPHWIQLKVHECLELDEVSSCQGHMKLKTRLYGCRDFLVVVAYEGGDDDDEDDTNIKQTLLFDLSTSQWQIIYEIPE